MKQQKKKEVQKVTKPGLFGKTLEDIMEIQRATKPELRIPETLQDAFASILLRGLATPEIFLRPCDKDALENLKKQTETGNNLFFFF